MSKEYLDFSSRLDVRDVRIAQHSHVLYNPNIPDDISYKLRLDADFNRLGEKQLVGSVKLEAGFWDGEKASGADEPPPEDARVGAVSLEALVLLEKRNGGIPDLETLEHWKNNGLMQAAVPFLRASLAQALTDMGIPSVVLPAVPLGGNPNQD